MNNAAIQKRIDEHNAPASPIIAVTMANIITVYVDLELPHDEAAIIQLLADSGFTASEINQHLDEAMAHACLTAREDEWQPVGAAALNVLRKVEGR